MSFACILFALRRESQPFCRLRSRWQTMKGTPCAARRSGDLLVLETGVGLDRTRAALDWLVPQAPTFAIFAGFCGALDPALKIGDVVIASEIVDEAGGCWRPTRHSDAPGCKIGRLLTTGHLVGDPLEKRTLCAKHQATIVDMESAAFARICTEKAIPFACVRAVSDDVETRLSPELVDLLAGGQVSPTRVVGAFVKRPALVIELSRLARHTKTAAANLAKALDLIIKIEGD